MERKGEQTSPYLRSSSSLGEGRCHEVSLQAPKGREQKILSKINYGAEVRFCRFQRSAYCRLRKREGPCVVLSCRRKKREGVSEE